MPFFAQKLNEYHFRSMATAVEPYFMEQKYARDFLITFHAEFSIKNDFRRIEVATTQRPQLRSLRREEKNDTRQWWWRWNKRVVLKGASTFNHFRLKTFRLFLFFSHSNNILCLWTKWGPVPRSDAMNEWKKTNLKEEIVKNRSKHCNFHV